jgi:hypothetical protein
MKPVFFTVSLRCCGPLFLLLLLMTASCKKPPTDPVEPIPAANTATLSLYRSWFTTFDTAKHEARFEYGRAMIRHDNMVVDGGLVKYGDSTLIPQVFTQLYYTRKPDDTVASFIPALNGSQLWLVTGNPFYKIPPFSTFAPAYPSFLNKVFDTLPVLRKSQPFTLSWDASVPCDSFSIAISQSNNYIQRSMVPGTTSTITFTPSQLAVFELFQPAYIIMEGYTSKKVEIAGVPVTLETYARRNCNVKIMN